MNVPGPYWWQVRIGSGNCLGAGRQQAITSADVELGLCRHMGETLKATSLKNISLQKFL